MSTETTPAALGEQALGRPAGGSVWDDGIPTEGELGVVDWLLSTTRANRKTLDLDRPVEPEVLEECLRLALQAPTAHNEQRWHWIIVTDKEKRERIAEVYAQVWERMTGGERRRPRRWSGATANNDYDRLQDSSMWLPDHLAEIPVHVIPCMVGPRYNNDMVVREWTKFMQRNGPLPEVDEPSRMWLDGGYFASIYPAVWSFQLALRSRGLGSVLTVVHLAAEQLVAKELGLPSTVVQTCLLPVAYTTKRTFQPAKRAPLESRISYNEWQGTR